jgi:hypothetical protein
MGMFGKVAFRCRGCRGRFYAPREVPPDEVRENAETDEIETGPVARREGSEDAETPDAGASGKRPSKPRFRFFGRGSRRRGANGPEAKPSEP